MPQIVVAERGVELVRLTTSARALRNARSKNLGASWSAHSLRNRCSAGAENAWDGEHELVSAPVEDTPLPVSYTTRVRQERLGGAWLQLLHAGHTLHLNTAAEAAEVARADRVKVG